MLSCYEDLPSEALSPSSSLLSQSRQFIKTLASKHMHGLMLSSLAAENIMHLPICKTGMLDYKCVGTAVLHKFLLDRRGLYLWWHAL